MVAVQLQMGLSTINSLQGNGFVGSSPAIKRDVLTTHIESFCKAELELLPLFEQHYNEISVHKKHGIKLDPDWDKYRMKEQAGELLFIALRRRGKLVGYFSGFIGTALHYKGVLQLGLDLIFVEPSSRGKIDGQHGGSMLRDAAILEARRRGVSLFTAGYKSFRANHMRKLLEDGGFEPFEVYHAKWI